MYNHTEVDSRVQIDEHAQLDDTLSDTRAKQKSLSRLVGSLLPPQSYNYTKRSVIIQAQLV